MDECSHEGTIYFYHGLYSCKNCGTVFGHHYDMNISISIKEKPYISKSVKSKIKILDKI